MQTKHLSYFLLGGLIALGLIVSASILGKSALQFKEYERIVTVKGLAEIEVPADTAIWPIRFVAASNQLDELYADMESYTQKIYAFLQENGFGTEEISTAAPLVTDKFAERYGDQNAHLRYSAQQTITVYSTQVERVRVTQQSLAQLGAQGVALSGDEYTQRISYLFTQLNEHKPELIEASITNARIAAQKFAEDSESKLGKLKRASQGQISIQDRDSSTPHLKKIRVVSTAEYYLVD